MKTRLLTSTLAAVAILGAAASVSAAEGWKSMTGVWKPDTPSNILRTVEGQAPPLNAAGKAAQQKTLADRKAGRTHDPIAECLPPGTPRGMWNARPMLLIDTPRKLTMIFEYMHLRRDIYLTDPIPVLEDLNPTWGGTSGGRREAEAFFIETKGFNGETFLDDQGLPASDKLKLTERIRLMPNGKLENRITVEDPVNYSRPFNLRMTYTKLPDKTVLEEHICNEKLLRFPVRNYWAEHQASLKAQGAR